MTYYKLVKADGTPSIAARSTKWSMPRRKKDSDWTPGRQRSVRGEIVPCGNGLHFADLKLLPYWILHYAKPDDVVCEIEDLSPDETILARRSGEPKYVTRRARLTKVVIDLAEMRELVEFREAVWGQYPDRLMKRRFYARVRRLAQGLPVKPIQAEMTQ